MNLPSAFVTRMKAMLGEEYHAFLASYDAPLHPALRLNRAKVKTIPAGLALGERVPWSEDGYYYDPDGDIRPGKHPWHEAGLYYIQEASAQLPASLCLPAQGERVLDLCAAPGGKATALGVALRGAGLLVANEISATRVAVLSQNIERMGIPNAIVTSESPAVLAKRFPAFFDKIVVDAPCSGEGMFRKEPQAMEMWSPENVAMCAERQLDILCAAAHMLAPNGYITYSTCTFAPDENEGVVMAFLAAHPDFEVVKTQNEQVLNALRMSILDRGHPTWVEGYEAYSEDIRHAVEGALRVFPHHAKGEGHFAVLLHQKGTPSESMPDYHSQRRKNDRESRKGQRRENSPVENAVKLFSAFAADTLSHIPTGTPHLCGDRLWLLPPDTPDDLNGLRVCRFGLCLGTVKGNRFEPDHALALALNVTHATKVFPLVSAEEQAAYLHGDVLPCSPALRGWHLLTIDDLPIGWGKASGGQMKNHYPRGLRRSL